jgi:hypothetical protein
LGPAIKSGAFFKAFLVTVAAVFLWMRPLRNAEHPFIEGDGLGYYAYLPAIFIAHDDSLQFRWFNAVHAKHYTFNMFATPEDNFVVLYKGRRINKYYPGLSFAWMPFFLVAHAVAFVTASEPDGFSAPYQAFIGIASLCYLLIGLAFLRKLLLKLGQSATAAALVPVLVFFGTHLFPFSVNVNSLTHSYSFCFIVLFVHTLACLAQEITTSRIVTAGFFLALIVCIRPLDGIVALVAPAFITIKSLRNTRRGNGRHTMLAGAGLMLLLAYQGWILYRQTGSLLPYTYPGEGFHPADPHFFSGLISYHMGLFVYVPLFLLALFGLPFVEFRLRWLSLTVFMLAVYIYGIWWYWHITPRGVVDFYVFPSVWLGALLTGGRKYLMAWLIGISVACAGYYQFKHFQLANGALDHWATTGEIYWRNFFRIRKAWMYPVMPSTIHLHETMSDDFEQSHIPVVTGSESQSGIRSVQLGPENAIYGILKAQVPSFVNGNRKSKKVRLNFQMMGEPGIGAVHCFLRFEGRGNPPFEKAFYLNKGDVPEGAWDLREFGTTLDDINGADSVSVIVWNVEGRQKLYLDDVRLDFYMTDNSFETTP